VVAEGVKSPTLRVRPFTNSTDFVIRLSVPGTMGRSRASGRTSAKKCETDLTDWQPTRRSDWSTLTVEPAGLHAQRRRLGWIVVSDTDVCCIQAHCAQNHTWTESSLQLRPPRENRA